MRHEGLLGQVPVSKTKSLDRPKHHEHNIERVDVFEACADDMLTHPFRLNKQVRDITGTSMKHKRSKPDMTKISPGDSHISETLRNTGTPPRHHRDTNETTPRRHQDINKALRSMTSTDILKAFASHQNKSETLPKLARTCRFFS